MFTKRISPLLFGACCWLLATGLPASSPAASSGSSDGQLDVNFFYDQLKNDGSWFNTTEYGDVWQPYVAYKSDSWRPYTDGYWTYTDGGWMFVSYENFGWAVYHYGRWTQLKDIGWAWVPGTEWSPAWVTWRESSPDGATENGQPAANVAATTGPENNADQGVPPQAPPPATDNGGAPARVVSDNYIGWAPLPPDPEPVVAGGYYSYGPTVDVDFGIDPYDYSFVDARYFGAPFIGGYLFDRDRSYYYAERSVNVTNIYYNRDGGYRGFYNGGPRYERFNGISERPIPRANIQREQGRAAQDAIRAGRVNQINGRNVSVYAPNFSQKNVRNGRVNFANRGALPVTQVNHERPANAANNAARERAQNTFRQQGEAFRAKNPGASNAQRAAGQTGQTGGPGGNPGIGATPRTRAQERAARQETRQEQRQGRGGAPNPAAAGRAENSASARNEPAAVNQRRATASAERQQARSSSGRSTRRSGNGAARASRSEPRQAVERAPRAPRVSGGGGGRSRGGGGGAGRAIMGGGGGRAIMGGGGGGGGRARAAGGGQGGGGGGGGKKKK